MTGPAANGDAPLMRSVEFRRGREEGWRRLDRLVDRIERDGVASLSAEEARELPLLYRAAASSLSVARAIVLDRHLLLYLENLCLRSYLAVYGPRARIVDMLRGFIVAGFPRAIRSMRVHMLAAALALTIGMAAGYVSVWRDIDTFHTFVSGDLAGGRGPESSAQELLDDELFPPWPGFEATFVVFANSLFRHNTTVGILAFGLGFMLGIPTVMLMVYNGLAIGAMIALHAHKGLTLDFVAWLSVHGITELLAVVICGAAGLVVAEKILFPGGLSRLESLAVNGRRAAGAVAGAVALFFIAGILEGGFRQLLNNTPARFAFGFLTAAAWLAYFRMAGRNDGADGQ